MNKNSYYQEKALERIFINIDQNGFWDSKKDRIYSRIEFDESWNWRKVPDNSDRYGVFAITCILLAGLFFGTKLSKYEDKIIRYLKYIQKQISGYSNSVLTYGAFNALVLGEIFYKKKEVNFQNEILSTFDVLRIDIRKIKNNEHSLVLIGLSCLYNYVKKDESVKHYISQLVEGLLKSQGENGFFFTGDIRAVYHQRVMYILWGLAFASRITHFNEIKHAIEKTVKYIWNHRRDGAGDAFLWHPPFYIIKYSPGFYVPILSNKSSKYLFECHQTFFVNTIMFYNYFFNDDKFNTYAAKALMWIFGKNRMNLDLVEITNLDVPARIMSKQKELFIKDQNFKGSYEVGSYILALSKRCVMA
jgi:hypothetical protein